MTTTAEISRNVISAAKNTQSAAGAMGTVSGELQKLTEQFKFGPA